MDTSIIQRAVDSRDPLIAEDALREYDVAIHRSSQPAERTGLLLGKAVLYGVFFRFEESRRALELAQAQSPDDPNIQLQVDYLNAGLYDQENKPREAFEHLSKVLRKYHRRLTTEPDLRFAYEDIQLRRGLDAVRIGRFQEAITLLEESLGFCLKTQDMSNALASLGRCYSELGKFEPAREYFLKTLKIGPTIQWEGEVHMRLGVACANLGFFEEAKREFQVCEQKAAEFGEYGIEINKTYRWLAWVCRNLGEEAESLKYTNLAHPI